MNSDTRMPASRSLRDDGRKRVVLAGDVEAAFGGALLAPLRHEADGMRSGRERDRDHLVGRRHLEIERLCRSRPSAAPCRRRGYGGGPRADAR